MSMWPRHAVELLFASSIVIQVLDDIETFHNDERAAQFQDLWTSPLMQQFVDQPHVPHLEMESYRMYCKLEVAAK